MAGAATQHWSLCNAIGTLPCARSYLIDNICMIYKATSTDWYTPSAVVYMSKLVPGELARQIKEA